MVKLVSQSKLESLHIDTIERAIVFSSLALKAAIVGVDGTNFTDKRIQVNVLQKGKNELVLKLFASLPLDTYLNNSYGGNFAFAIKLFDVPELDIESLINPMIPHSNPISPMIPAYPNFVKNLETYLCYYALMLSASLSDNRNEVIKIVLQEENFKGSAVKFDITLPLDAKKWVLGNNLISCVKRVVELYQANISEFNIFPAYASILNENVTLNNNLLLGN
jgi:hypothetical protein